MLALLSRHRSDAHLPGYLPQIGLFSLGLAPAHPIEGLPDASPFAANGSGTPLLLLRVDNDAAEMGKAMCQPPERSLCRVPSK
jgi:hypothetical protein